MQGDIFQSRLFIERNLGEELNGEKIADRAFLSYYHFQHRFKEHTGESLWQYVKRLRLEKACFLLKYTSTSISEISIEAGFSTQAAFSKAFSGYYGLSPQKFRGSFMKSIQNQGGREIDWNAIKTVRSPDQRILSIRVEGIKQFPKGSFKWQQLIGAIEKQGAGLIGKSPDQPGITAPHKLRWDTSVSEASLPRQQFEELLQNELLFQEIIPAGNYVIVPFIGFGRPVAEFLPELLNCLRTQGLEWQSTGSFFQVLRKHAIESKCVTDLYIPIV